MIEISPRNEIKRRWYTLNAPKKLQKPEAMTANINSFHYQVSREVCSVTQPQRSFLHSLSLSCCSYLYPFALPYSIPSPFTYSISLKNVRIPSHHPPAGS